MELHAKTEVRLVGTEAVHCLLPSHALDRKGNLHTEDLFEESGKQSLIDIDHVIHIDERKFHIDLGKFRLTVCTKIFITETFCDLEIPVISGAHKQLF